MFPVKSKTPKIYKNKKLNTACFGGFRHSDYQIFLDLISKIGGVDENGKYLQPGQLKREHILTATEHSKKFNLDVNNSYRYLKKACDKLMEKTLRIESLDGEQILKVNVCSSAKYDKKEGQITIRFTDDIMPYLAQVKEKFMLYNIKEISNFNSLYTTRLYELVQEYKTTGWMEKPVTELRKIFTTGQKFKKYNDFKRKTFGHAVKEINKNHPNIKLSFEEKKESRKVVVIKFIFNAVKDKPDTSKIINQTAQKAAQKF